MEEKKQAGKGFAITALIMGILAIVNSFIPFLNIISYIFAILAVIFGIVGIVKKTGRAMAIVGLVLGGVSLILATAINAGTSTAIDEVLNDDSVEQTEKNNSNSNNSKPKFSYTIDSQYLGDYGLGYYIEGTVTNNRDKEYSYVHIEFICYDAAGNNIGTASDTATTLLGNQTWKYKAMFLGSNDESVDHCDYHEMTSW